MEKSVEGKTINVPIVSALRRVHDGEYQASTIMYQPKAFSSSPKHEGDEMRSIGRTSVPLPCPVIKLQYHVAMSAALETAFHPSIRPCVRSVHVHHMKPSISVATTSPLHIPNSIPPLRSRIRVHLSTSISINPAPSNE